jgi:transcription termination factor Rho
VVELLGNGSGFVRVSPPDPSDEDVYISAGQVRRCELVSGDVVAGPVRKPRRSERYPSMVRIDTINGTPADEVAEGTRYDDLPAGFPSERLALGSDDVTVKAIEWLTPFGKGSRVTITGPARAGKTEALRRIAAALAPSAAEGGSLELAVVLAGVRPEEISAWNEGPVTPLAAASFAASQDAQSQVIENAVEQARRMAVRGADVVLLIDTLDAAGTGAARRALASARNLIDGGSLTVVATAAAPVGGETTVIALDLNLASARRYPALDLAASGVLHPELLVGEAGADAITKARLEAFGQI